METSLISIVVPVYNAQKYLNRCLESIVNQTYKNLEILLVDDGSKDNSPAMCDEWAQKDSRIKVIHIENGGVANARNTALKWVQGDYVAFVDGDDCIECDMYEKMKHLITQSNADIAVCDYQINDQNRGLDETENIPVTDCLKLIATGDYKYGVLWNKLYRKSVIQDITMPAFVCCEDMVFNYFVFKNASSVVQSGLKLYHYFQNDDSTVHKGFGRGAFDTIKSKEIILNDIQDALMEYAVKGYMTSAYFVLGGILKNQMFLDEYDSLRKGMLRFKGCVLRSSVFSLKDKIKILLLAFFPKLFNLLLKKGG